LINKIVKLLPVSLIFLALSGCDATPSEDENSSSTLQGTQSSSSSNSSTESTENTTSSSSINSTTQSSTSSAFSSLHVNSSLDSSYSSSFSSSSIDIEDDSDAPRILTPIFPEVKGGDSFSIQVLTKKTNDENLSFSLSNNPSFVNINSSGLLTITPKTSVNGEFSFSIKAVGDTLSLESESIVLSVKAFVQEDIENKEVDTLRVISTQYDVAASLSLNFKDAISYKISNLPQWASLDTNSGVVNVTPNGDRSGHAFYDVEVTTSSGVEVYKKALRITLMVPEDIFAQRAKFLDDVALPIVATTSNAITHTSPRFFPKANGESCVVLAYYPNYSNDNQIFVVDLEDGTTKNVDTTIFKDDTINLFKHVYIGDGKSFVAWPTHVTNANNTFMRYSIYDTNTHTWNADIIPVDTHLQNATTGFDIVQGTDAKVYVLASSDGSNSNGGVIEIDTQNSSSIYYDSMPINGGIGQVGADATHIYISTNKYGVGDLLSIKRSTKEVTVLETNVNYKLYQRKNGVVFKNSSNGTWHYMYNGVVVDGGGDLNTLAPWGADSSDLYADSYYSDIPSKIPGDWDEDAWDTSAMTPANTSSTGYFWYKYKPTSANNFTKITLNGINTQSALQNRIMSLGNGKILTTNDAYLGMNIYDTNTKLLQHYQLADGSPSIYTLTKKNEYTVIMSGYFDAPYIEYDSTKIWDNMVNAQHNPNNSPSYQNPKNHGAIGHVANISKAYGSTFGSNGKYYFSGKKVRSGNGGGVGVYDTATKVTTSISGFESSHVRDLVSVGEYVVAASVGAPISSPLKLSVIDTTTQTVVRSTVPLSSITLNQGRLATDGEYVYCLSISDDNTKTYIFKYNPENGVLTSTVFPFTTKMDATNDVSGTSLIYNKEDGFLYATFGDAGKDIVSVFSRIDTTTLLAEPVARSTSVMASRFDFLDKSVYFVSGTNIRKLESVALTDGFTTLSSTDVFSHLSVSVGSTNTAVTYVNDGSNDIGYNAVGSNGTGSSVYPITTVYPQGLFSGTLTLKFTLTVNSGTVKLGGAEYYLDTAWGGTMNGLGGTYTQGSYEIESNPLTVTNLQRIILKNRSIDEPIYDIDVSNVRIESY